MATTPDDSKSYVSPEALNDHKALLRDVQQAAVAVISDEPDPFFQSQRLRLMAEELGCPISERTAAIYLARARGETAGVSVPRMKGERMDTTPTPWAWEGVIMAGTFNLLVAPPKVGKSALMVGMIGAWWRGDEAYLGQPLHGPCPKVFIVGTDQPENDWHTLFQREGLVAKDGGLGGPVEMLWHTGAPLHLTAEGIAHLGEIAEANPRSLFLLDSYHACISPLGVDEATSAFDGPARDLAHVLAPHHATLAMIHHTNKSVAGGNATNASRGSNALPAAASLTILMNWFRQPAEGQTQKDHRVILKTQGRAKGTTLLIELQDDGWIHHGDGDAVLQGEALQEAADDLQGRAADIFDYINERWILGSFPCTVSELGRRFNLEANKIHRCLRSLNRKGLVHQVGQAETGAEGGRPAALYAPIAPLPSEPQINVKKVKNPEEAPTYAHARAQEIRGLSPSSPSFPLQQGGEVYHLAPEGLSPLSEGDAVERFAGGKWSNGWVVHDASNPLSITIAKLGQPLVQFRNQRPDLDIRPCQGSAFPAPAETVDPFDF
tara:strand:+ start:1054 stop:2703 length:1650 start_codon:yes stop_codon:yes gene_type:complete